MFSNKITDVFSPENRKRLKIVVCLARLEMFSTCRAEENNKLGIVFVLWSTRVITLSVLETLTTRRGESCILQRTDKEESAKRAAPSLLAVAERWDELSSRKGEKRRNDARCARAQNGNPLGTRLHVAVFARRTRLHARCPMF